MSKEKEIVDLVPQEDGTFGVKPEQKKIQKQCTGVKPTYNRENMDQLFHGIDVGLEFMEGILPRIKKISNLKKLVR